MCKITAPYAKASQAPLSWEELHSSNLLVDADFPMVGESPVFESKAEKRVEDDFSLYFGGESTNVFGSELLFPQNTLQQHNNNQQNYYDMSLFGLFPQQDSTTTITSPVPDVPFNNQVLFDLPMQSMQSVQSVTSPSDETSMFPIPADPCMKLEEATAVVLQSPKSDSSKGSTATAPQIHDPHARLQKRKLGNSNAKKSEEGVSEEVRRKRQKQREAAQRCREKRLGEIERAEERAAKSEAEKLELLIRVKVLEGEKKAWIEMERQLQKKIYQLSQGKMQF